AALLIEQGHDVSVFEKEDTVSELGAGIGIAGNVIEILNGHDLAKGLKNIGQFIDVMEVRDDKDKQLSKLKLKKNTVNLTISRQSLLDMIKSYVPDSVIFTNHNVTGIENGDLKVTLQFSEQTSQSFDLCIGADGIHSNIRQALVPNSKPIDQGYTVFRGLVEDIDLKDNHI